MKRAPIFLFLILLVTGVPAIVEFYTDWLWFQEVGYEQVFLRSLTARSLITTAVGLAAFALLAGNLLLAMKALRPRPFMIATPQGPQTIMVDPASVKPLALLAVAGISVMIGLFSGGQWQAWLFFLHGVPFGTTDPILGRDVGFYVFTLPLLEHLYGLLLFLVFLMLVVAVAAHVVSGAVSLDPVRGLSIGRTGMRHISLLAAAGLAVLAFGAWLHVPQLLTAATGVVAGASYVDVHARMPAQRVLLVATIIGAGIALWSAFNARGIGRLALAAGLYVAVMLGGSAYATIIQRFVVAPNEQVRETPFIVHNIAATRAAFGLADVQERPLSGEARLTRADLERNASTIENVPLWNDRPLLDTFGQLQEIRTYYDFAAVDNDRYVIDGKYRQIMLSARELNSQSLPSRTWINEHLTFTHGYGLTLGPVNEVTPEGLPVLFIRDLPPVSTQDLRVTQPAIYYGELANEHVFVRTRTEEFDYPRGDDNVFTSYAGNGGIQLSSAWRRLLFALRFRSTDTFFSPNLVSDSRVMLYRRIADRMQRIAPFLEYDPDPYLTITDGRLVWMQDVYTTSTRYPYASSARGANVNYIRNSVKATVDAYHGTTTFHIVDPADPIAQTIGRIFPSLLKPIEAMPEDLRTRLRYPQQIFALQAAMFATFHMTNPAVFYNREDQWEVPSFDLGNQRQFMDPYYTIMKLPGESGAEYIQMLPYTPRGKDNLAAWMVARNDGPNYGRLAVFQFPKQTVIFGPKQISARISQDQAIAPQITLWNQQGSEVIQGTLLVIPIEEALIYVRPLYLRASGGSIPELKRVIVAYQNQIVMAETLDAALAQIFPAGAAPPAVETVEPAQRQAPPPAASTDLAGLAAEARATYERALQAQRDGDWARYGDEIKKLGDILSRMKR